MATAAACGVKRWAVRCWLDRAGRVEANLRVVEARVCRHAGARGGVCCKGQVARGDGGRGGGRSEAGGRGDD